MVAGLMRRIAALLSGNRGGREIYRAMVRCERCGEEIPLRVDLSRDLTPTYGEGKGAYHVRKGVMGSGRNRCFRTIEVRLWFDSEKRIVGREAKGGSFIDEESLEEDR
jgi:hypothetical protein